MPPQPPEHTCLCLLRQAPGTTGHLRCIGGWHATSRDALHHTGAVLPPSVLFISDKRGRGVGAGTDSAEVLQSPPVLGFCTPGRVNLPPPPFARPAPLPPVFQRWQVPCFTPHSKPPFKTFQSLLPVKNHFLNEFRPPNGCVQQQVFGNRLSDTGAGGISHKSEGGPGGGRRSSFDFSARRPPPPFGYYYVRNRLCCPLTLFICLVLRYLSCRCLKVSFWRLRCPQKHTCSVHRGNTGYVGIPVINLPRTVLMHAVRLPVRSAHTHRTVSHTAPPPPSPNTQYTCTAHSTCPQVS